MICGILFETEHLRNQTNLSGSHDYGEHVLRFSWNLDKIWRSNIRKCVLHRSASWWRYNRPMWKLWGRGSALAFRECVCTVEVFTGPIWRTRTGKEPGDNGTAPNGTAAIIQILVPSPKSTGGVGTAARPGPPIIMNIVPVTRKSPMTRKEPTLLLRVIQRLVYSINFILT